MVLIFDLLILAFFGHGELLVCHSQVCRLVSGSYSKIHVSSPVMTCLKTFLSFSMRSRRSRHTFLRFSFCLLVRIFGTSLAQITKMEKRNLEQCYAIKFCVELNDNATETYEKLKWAYGEHAVSIAQVFRWHKALLNG